MIVYLARDIPAFVMYCVNGASRSMLLIEFTDYMMIGSVQAVCPFYGGCYQSGHCIIESVDSISREERDAQLTQYITNPGITRARYIITNFKYHNRVL